ncbi:hypothetical protein D3C78_1665780 [compost metagenome]
MHNIIALEKGEIFTGKHFKGNIRVIEVNEESNELKVELNKEGSYWLEIWNLAHTRTGIDNGEYFKK